MKKSWKGNKMDEKEVIEVQVDISNFEKTFSSGC